MSGRDTFHPYDMTVNHIRRTDVTIIHEDCDKDGDVEYTNLIYLNPNWNPDNHGETIFLQEDDFLTAITPKFGRYVIFDGRIGHSARPSSLDMSGKIPS